MLGTVIVWASDSAGQAPVVSDFIVDTGNGNRAFNSGDADLISGDVHTVVTGTLVSTANTPNAAGGMPFVIEDTAQGDIDTDTSNDGLLTADDAFSAFGLLSNSDTRVDATRTYTSFYVASNEPFSIDAQTFLPSNFTDFVLLSVTRLEMAVTLSGDDGLAFGSAAQYPHSGGPTGGMLNVPSLWSLLPGRRVFEGNRRTALSEGSIADQSVRFDNTYSIRAQNLTGYDLSLGTFDFEVDVVYTVYIP